MNEEMVEFVREAFEGGEIDMDYEFYVPKFYDFTRPETGREAEDAEEWFLSAGGYQPSRMHFQKHWFAVCVFVKLGKLGKLSALATLDYRVTKKLGKLEEKSQNSPPPTKRQKLEAGYVRKVAEQLKHQPFWLHKVPKKVRADAAGPKISVPKEPNLETANRAQRRRYKFNAKPGEQSKIHRAPPWPSLKKSTIQATEFQVFRLRTSARAMQQTYVHHVTNGPNSS